MLSQTYSEPCYTSKVHISSSQSADFGDFIRKTLESQALLMIKISDEQKMVETLVTPHEKGLKVYFMFLIPLHLLILH